jgi:hypothetical protein
MSYVVSVILIATADNSERQEEERIFRMVKVRRVGLVVRNQLAGLLSPRRSGGADHQTAGKPEVDRVSGRT